MGGATSKATRRFPTEKPSWAGSRSSAPGITPRAPPLQSDKPLAYENKNEAIEADAKDPHFMAKLSRLGPVRVDHHMQTVRTASDIQQMHHSRMQSETEASSMHPAKNHLLVSSLAELLDTRKSVVNPTELETLARRYQIDITKLQQLARVVNTPSIDERTVVRTTDRHGEESVTMMAHWVDPALYPETR